MLKITNGTERYLDAPTTWAIRRPAEDEREAKAVL